VSKNQIIDQIKIWLTPGVVGVLGMFIWRDLTELRSDVKKLLAQGTEDHIKIAQLEADMDLLKKRVFFKETTAFLQQEPLNWQLIAFNPLGTPVHLWNKTPSNKRLE
jgi:hypothetical protein